MSTISPYTTPADYKYVPMPFKELLTAGMMMDKNVNASIKAGKDIKNDIEFREDDVNSARRVWQADQDKINARVNDIYKNPGSHQKHAQAFFDLERDMGSKFGERAAHKQRLVRENELKKTIVDSKWDGEEKAFLEEQIQADDFDESYDPATGRAGEVNMGGYEVPTFMTGKDMQARANQILSNSKEDLLKKGSLSEAEHTALEGVNTLDEYFTWADTYGKDKGEISRALAESITPGEIASAQLMQDARGTGIDESKFHNPITNAFDTETIWGGILNGAATLASYEKQIDNKVKGTVPTKTKEDKKKEKAKKEAKKQLSVIMPGGTQIYYNIENDATTPEEIELALNGDPDDPDNDGINGRILAYEATIAKWNKNDPKISASDAATAYAQLGYSRIQKQTLQEVMKTYKDKYASAELFELEELDNDETRLAAYQGDIDESYEPDSDVQFLAHVLHSEEFLYYKQDHPNAATPVLLYNYVRDELKQPDYLVEDYNKAGVFFNIEKNGEEYINNIIDHDQQKLDIVADISEILQSKSEEIKKTAAKQTKTISIEMFPERMADATGKHRGEKSDDPDTPMTNLINENTGGYNFYNYSPREEFSILSNWFPDAPEFTNVEKPFEDPDNLLNDKERKAKYKNATLHAIGTTKGSKYMKTGTGKPYVAVNLIATNGEVLQSYLVAPKAGTDNTIYNMAAEAYELTKGVGQEHPNRIEGEKSALEQAERIYNSEQLNEFQESIGGYDINSGDIPMPPEPYTDADGVKHSTTTEYLINLNADRAIRKEQNLYRFDPKTGAGNVVKYKIPAAAPISITQASDGTVKAVNYNKPIGVNPNNGDKIFESYTFSKDGGAKAWQTAAKYAAKEMRITRSTQNLANGYLENKFEFEKARLAENPHLDPYIFTREDGSQVNAKEQVISQAIEMLIAQEKQGRQASYLWDDNVEARLREGLRNSIDNIENGKQTVSYPTNAGPTDPNTGLPDDEFEAQDEQSGTPSPSSPPTGATGTTGSTGGPPNIPIVPPGTIQDPQDSTTTPPAQPPIQQPANPTPEPSPEIDAVIDPVMDFEKANGYGNYGLTSEKGNLTKDEAKKIYKEVYYPMVEDLPQALQIVGMDIDVNQRDHYSEMMIAAGDMTPEQRKYKLYGVKGDPDNMGEQDLFSAEGKKNKDYLESEMYEEWNLGGKKAVMDAFNKDPEGFLDKLATERKRAYSTNGASQKQVDEWHRRVDESTARAKKSLKLGK